MMGYISVASDLGHQEICQRVVLQSEEVDFGPMARTANSVAAAGFGLETERSRAPSGRWFAYIPWVRS